MEAIEPRDGDSDAFETRPCRPDADENPHDAWFADFDLTAPTRAARSMASRSPSRTTSCPRCRVSLSSWVQKESYSRCSQFGLFVYLRCGADRTETANFVGTVTGITHLPDVLRFHSSGRRSVYLRPTHGSGCRRVVGPSIDEHRHCGRGRRRLLGSELVHALQTGNIGGAALDVTEDEPPERGSPLWDFEDVVLTPHMAGGSPQVPERVAELFAENYRRFVAGDLDRMRNRVI